MGLFDGGGISIPTLQDVGNTIKRGASDYGRAIRSQIGDIGYVRPDTAPFLLTEDYSNIEKKKRQAEGEEAAARQRAEQSANTMEGLRKKQMDFANQLATNADRDRGLLIDRAAYNARNQLAQSLTDIGDKVGATNAGYRKKLQAEASAKSRASLAQTQAGINEQIRNQQMDARNLADQLGLEAAGVQANQADQYYQMAIQNLQNRNANLDLLMQGGAGLLGTYAGNQQRERLYNSLGQTGVSPYSENALGEAAR